MSDPVVKRNVYHVSCKKSDDRRSWEDCYIMFRSPDEHGLFGYRVDDVKHLSLKKIEEMKHDIFPDRDILEIEYRMGISCAAVEYGGEMSLVCTEDKFIK